MMSTRRDSTGQILVIFALSLMILIAMTGLALDGGSTFSQRRDQQTAADLAALAAANDYLINNVEAQAVAQAQAIAASNGFADGTAGTVVTVTVDTSNGVAVRVTIDRPHPNSFLAIVGISTWPVSTEAQALAGFPDKAFGASPFIFPISAFDNDGTPKYQTPTDFGEVNGDIPIGDKDLAWTNFGTGNLDTQEVGDIIDGSLEINKALAYGEYIGQHNNGNHTQLFQDVNTYLSGLDLPVAVVDASGNFMGWATFHVISADGSSNKHVNGYFVSSFDSARLTVASCAANACPRYLGSYVLKLTE
jgi:Flp pilus assembly protein TadG